MATRSALDEAIRARKRKEEEKKAKEAKEAINRQASAPSYAQSKPKTERVKDDSINRQATPPPYAQGKKDDPRNRQAAPPSYAQPKENKVFIPTWRSSAPPPTDGSQQRKQQGPQPAPSSGWNTPSWRSAGPPVVNQFGDREPLSGPSSSLQVGLTSPRANTGPAGIGSTAPQPSTLTTPSIQPWKPPQWDMEAERDRKLGTPFPAMVNRPDDSINRQASPPAYATGGMLRPPVVPEREFTPSEDRVLGAAAAAGQWASDAWNGATNQASQPENWQGADLSPFQPSTVTAYERVKDDFTGSAAYEQMQYNMAESRKPTEGIVKEATNWAGNTQTHAAETRGKLGQAVGDWWAGKQGMWDTAKNLYDIAYNAESTAPQAPNLMEAAMPVTNQAAEDVVNVLTASQQFYLNKKTEDIIGPEAAKALGVEGNTIGSTSLTLVTTAYPALYGAVWNGHFDPRDIAKYAGNELNQELDAYRKAVTPSLQDIQTMTGDEIARNQARAMLNYNSPQQVAATYRKLSDQKAAAENMLQQAQMLQQMAEREPDPKKRAEIMAYAADLGYQGQDLKDKHPQAIVAENAGGWKQMLFELMLPDFSDVMQAGVSAMRLGPKARRMDKVASQVIVSDAEMKMALDKIPVAPPTGKIAEAVTPPTGNSFLGTVPQARAEIDSHNIYKVVATLLADTSNSSDIRLLLTQFARDPRKLVEGMPANLFQSEKILKRADSDGMVRFGSMGLNTEQVQSALNSFRSVADDFLANSSSLKVQGDANKISVMAEIAEATQQGGYRLYGVATDAGNAAFGAAGVNVRAVANGQAYLEYVDEAGKIVGTSDRMTLLEANRRSGQLKKELKAGKLADTEKLKLIGDIQRKIVSPLYILTNPGTWETNAGSAVSNMLTDDTWLPGTTASREAHQARLFGGVRPTKRSMEGADTAAGFAGAQSGLVGKLRKGYGAVEEFFANKTADRTVLDTMRQYGPRVFENALTPILKQNGITDEKLIKQINARLYEVGYNGGDMMAELGRFITNNSQPFSLSAVNPRIMEAIDPEKIEEFYTILKSTPDRTVMEQKLATFFDESRTSWENQISAAPPVAQRHSWMKDEAKQDMADFTQANNLAVQKGGITPEQAAQSKAARAASDQALAQKMETLTAMVSDAQNPANRYVVYDAWMEIRKATEDVRMFQAEAVEIAYIKNSAEGWAEYHAKMDAAWKERDAAVDAVMQSTATALHSQAPVNPNMGVWEIVERTAKTAENKLYETLRLEPTSGRWDNRLQQVIAAGRALVDKKAAEVFAAARRFNSPSAMDEIVSAERNARIAGGQASNYLRKEAEKAAKTKNWDRFYQVRNEVWRQLRVYEATVYDIAKRNIVEEGLGMGGGTGQKFTYFDEEVELIRPIEKKQAKATRMGPRVEKVEDVQQYWQVKKPDGKIELVAEAQIPKDVLEQARAASVKPADIDAELQMEMDNLASGAALAPEAQSVANLGTEGTTVWRSPQGDRAVEVEPVNEVNGVMQYRTPDGQTIPETDLYVVTKDKKLRKVSDAETLRAAPETIQMNMEEIKAANEALLDMRKEWDRVARGNRGYLKLENAAGLYVKDGIAKVPDTKFEDLYGVTINGRRINSQADVEAFLEEYARLRDQARNKRRMTDETRYAAQEARLVTVDVELIRKDLNLGAGASEEIVAKTRRTTTAMGGTQAPSIGLGAQHALDQIEQVRAYVMKNLDNILAPVGKMGDAQALNVLDAFKRKVIPSWDNVKYAAAEAADRMRSFTHIDFRNRTGADNILGLGTPYSFYYTRAAKNALERMIFEPAAWRRMQQLNQDITEIREQRGDPKRYDGAVPAWIGDTLYYIRVSPAKYWAMFPNMIGNDYANPESANNAFSFGVEAASAAGFGMYPWLDAAGKVANGQTADISIPGYSQQTTIMSWATMAQMGYNNKVPHMLLPSNYEYNLSREIENMVARGEVDSATGLLAQDILEQQKKGLDPLPGQKMTPELLKILNEANSRAANIQLTSNVSSYLTSVSVKPYDPIESQTAAAVEQYRNRAYGPENPYGSREAVNQSFVEHPEMSNRFAKSNLFDTDPGAIRAGVSAENSMKGKEEERIYTEMNQAAQAYIQSHPEATDQDVQAIKQPYFDQLDALKAKYPNAGYPEGQGGPPKGMSPAERAQWELTRIIRASKADKPEYPEGGTPSQMQEYYKAMGTFTPEQRAMVERNLNSLLSMDETEMPGISQWKNELRKLVANQYASELIRMDEVRNASPEEQDWSDRMEVVKELNDIQRKQAEDRIRTELGQNAANLYATYSAMEKGSEAKAQFKRDHPEVAAAVMLAYNPQEYAEAQKLFGKDAWKVFFDPNYPQWPGDNPTEEQKAAYNKAMDAYNKANPQSEEIRLWVNGRKRPDGANGGTVGGPVSLSGIDYHQQIAQTPIYYDFGADWTEAKRIFGNNIFDVLRDFPQTDDKKVVGQYLGAHPELYGYWEWRKELTEHPERAGNRGYTWDVPSQTLRDAVEGQPRPLGSNAQPIGYAPPVTAPEGKPLRFDGALPINAPPPGSAGAAPSGTPIQFANAKKVQVPGMGTELPSTTASTAAGELPATKGSATTPTTTGTDKTWLEYANQNPKFVENAARQAEWAAQRKALTDQFGEEAVGLYNQYLELPKDSEERKQFKREHPEVKLAIAWLYGRQTEEYSPDNKEAPKNNGADYAEAKERFGDGIWDLFKQYDSQWSKAQKRAFYNEHPEYGDFTDWWYGDDGKGDYVKRSFVRRGGGGGRGKGGGGGKGKGGLGGYWFGNWWIDENGIPHWGGPDGPVADGPIDGLTSGEEPLSATAATAGADKPVAPVDQGFSRDGVRREQQPAAAAAPVDPGFSRDGKTRAPETSPVAENPPNDGGKPAKHNQIAKVGQELMQNIAKYRAAALEDPHNDWLTHLPKEVAEQELKRALANQKQGSYNRNSRYQNNNYVPYLDPRYMDRDLQLNEQNIRPWRPQNIDFGWMSAGNTLRPDEIRPWRPARG